MKKLLLLTTIILSSCLTEKRAIKKIALISAKHPNVLALSCADKFPNKETIEVRETIKLDTLLDIDTLYRDSIINNELVKYVYLPGKTITKTIKRDSVIRIENTAKVFLLEEKLKASNEVLIDYKHKLKFMKTILYFGFIILCAFVLLKKVLW
jgi:hypothetical protein